MRGISPTFICVFISQNGLEGRWNMDATGINRSNPSVETPNTPAQNVERGQNNNSTRENIKDSAEERRNNTRELENVVSISEDGDTVQVDPNTETTAQRAGEGAVTMRESDTRSEENSEPPEITSFAGYSASQIEQLYLQGRISRQEYETQMANRQERSSTNEEQNSANAKELARLNGTLSRAEMDASAINTAFSNRANDNAPISGTERIAAMERVSDNTRQQQTAVANEGRRQWDYQLQA